MRSVTNLLIFFFLVTVFAFTDSAYCFESNDGFCGERPDQNSYSFVKVIAHQRKSAIKKSPENAIKAEVYLNGVFVGRTPYEDCLPEGEYSVEVRTTGFAPYKRRLKALPGERYTICGDFRIRMTQQERAALEKKEQKEKILKREKQQKEKLKEWKALQKAWKLEAAPFEKERKPFLVKGTMFLLGGAGVLIAGGVLEGKAFNYHEKAEEAHDSWLDTSGAVSDGFQEDMEEYQRVRNIYHAFGIPCFVLGGAALVTAFVIYLKAPCLPERPKRPEGLKINRRTAKLSVVPLVTEDTFGWILSGRF